MSGIKTSFGWLVDSAVVYLFFDIFLQIAIIRTARREQRLI